MPKKQNESALSDHAQIKRLVLEAIASEPLLAGRLVFKGGSALEILYGIGMRSSIDLDFSISTDFSDSELLAIESRFTNVLNRVFSRFGATTLDLHLEPKPRTVSADLAAFWGGYSIQFKIIDKALAARIGNDREALGRNALTIGPQQRRTFEIDISRHEWCVGKEPHSLGDATLFAYSPRMIVAEKLRAICQQMPEYRAVVRSRGSSPRARDFFDIHNLIDRFVLILATPEFFDQLCEVFQAKRVPIELLWHVGATREFHRADYPSVVDSVPPGIEVLSFDEYFDSVLALVRDLQALGNE